MIKHLIELIKQALNKMIGNPKQDNSIDSSVSETMVKAISLWKKMYKNKAPWVSADTGVISIGIPKLICKAFKQQVLSEMKTDIIDPNISTEVDKDKQEETKTRADYLNNVYKKKLIKKLSKVYEKALALGGVIIKPYIKNDQVYFDFNYQGEFYPIAFDDDGNIADIAFLDQFRSGDILYTKVERQTFEYNTVTIENKAFKVKLDANGDENTTQELGEEIPLTEVEKWSTLESRVEIENVEKPLYGYYCEPISNNIDMDSPLGISFFSDAKDLIQKADEQFGRLDWEYEGGQMAIDVDPTALHYENGYYGTHSVMDRMKDRLYRSLDLGASNTYNAFAPTLRDASYLDGLNNILMRIEDALCLSRGTISNVEAEARTATEIRVLKQKAYDNIVSHQEALEDTLMDTVYAMNVLVDLYELAPDGDYDTTVEWGDSVLTDTDTELQQKIQLVDADILDKAEVRAWYTGESLEVATKKIKDMQKEKQENMMNDLFNNGSKTNELENEEE
jgi:A118 family predicted phage portal protein|nr:MAG TPA: portal protein [Caudoviricetes sp.]